MGKKRRQELAQKAKEHKEEQDKLKAEEEERKKTEEETRIRKQTKINDLKKRIDEVDAKLKDNILLKRYSNYDAYRKISAELRDLKKRIQINLLGKQKNKYII